MISRREPGHVVVVGAGFVGLCTAWFLRRYGVEVTVLERGRTGEGASWGNAGWLSPALAVPLPEPATLRAGLSGFLSPSAPLYVPADPRLAPFLLSLARNSTSRRWNSGMAALAPLNNKALAAHDELPSAVTETLAPCLIATRNHQQRQVIVTELERVRAAGQHVEFELLTGVRARELEPTLSSRIGSALRLHGQRCVDPVSYVRALAAAVSEKGVHIEEGAEVTSVEATERGARVHTAAGAVHEPDAVVLANGALLDRLAHGFGVRRHVRAGRGYSFSVIPRVMPSGPVYFPAEKVVCTPLGDRLRVSGMMEFRPADAPLDPRRITSVLSAARLFVRDVDWDTRSDEWVGARPCTTDGLPLIGPTLSSHVYVAGGHGMWGMTHGPVSGKLLADTIVTGAAPVELAPLHPLR
ncbi:amino acid dehydrogenase [Prauserella marina]|uniref:D-amino-acid dehydrogenase n=1 Tax=Prauserella marina TaxID=530584 RepID=A0A222VM30_9PSEU|nr:FAD-dependent oxidoreductase [Prauserella marina]ASR34978.1 amino acid dehydrogenase [Prauserella marina]PWV85298.1 glycine/D-amino acid oxidase-like deaminating enzyme [Prauserella marina]SDC00277.1 D-amino-acid dehydrogenase [Prauserella marina]